MSEPAITPLWNTLVAAESKCLQQIDILAAGRQGLAIEEQVQRRVDSLVADYEGAQRSFLRTVCTIEDQTLVQWHMDELENGQRLLSQYLRRRFGPTLRVSLTPLHSLVMFERISAETLICNFGVRGIWGRLSLDWLRRESLSSVENMRTLKEKLLRQSGSLADGGGTNG